MIVLGVELGFKAWATQINRFPPGPAKSTLSMARVEEEGEETAAFEGSGIHLAWKWERKQSKTRTIRSWAAQTFPKMKDSKGN